MRFDYASYAKELKKDATVVEQAVAIIRKEVKLHGPRLVQEELAQLDRIPVDRGTYRRSFMYADIPHGAVIYNFAKHAPVIELGRRPGGRMPPLQAIYEWVRRKKIGATFIGPVRQIHGPRQNGERKPGIKALRAVEIEKQQRHIALQIARKIRARGLPARMVIARAAQQLDGRIRSKIAKAIGGV